CTQSLTRNPCLAASRIAHASRPPCLPRPFAAAASRSTSVGVRYSRSRTSALRGRRGVSLGEPTTRNGTVRKTAFGVPANPSMPRLLTICAPQVLEEWSKYEQLSNRIFNSARATPRHQDFSRRSERLLQTPT